MRENLRLVPPSDRTSYYHMRGSYLGFPTNRSTRCTDKAKAGEVLRARKEEIKRNLTRKPEADRGPTFAELVTRYARAGGDERFLDRIVVEMAGTYAADIDQDKIEDVAQRLYPTGTPATRNRQVFTPILAVLRHGRIAIVVDRPKGCNGTPREAWLKAEDAQALIDAAWQMHPRFAALLTFLLYTGCRLGEALDLTPGDLHLEESFANIRRTKNGKPRGVFLPPIVVAAVRRALMEPVNGCYTTPVTQPRAAGTVFALTSSGSLYNTLNRVEARAVRERDEIDASVTDDMIVASMKAGRLSPIIPAGVSFHIFRHTYGAWCRRYGKLDRAGLVATGAWASAQGAASYDHIDVSEAARAANLFPGATGTSAQGIKVVGIV